jgi:hypothetical protein
MTIDWDDKNLYRQVVEQVEEIGLQRMKAQPDMSEADFFAGAMATMTALGLTPNKYPARWTLGLMFDTPPLAWRMENELQARGAFPIAQDTYREPGSET